jgi:hypothetical protein
MKSSTIPESHWTKGMNLVSKFVTEFAITSPLDQSGDSVTWKLQKYGFRSWKTDSGDLTYIVEILGAKYKSIKDS